MTDSETLEALAKVDWTKTIAAVHSELQRTPRFKLLRAECDEEWTRAIEEKKRLEKEAADREKALEREARKALADAEKAEKKAAADAERAVKKAAVEEERARKKAEAEEEKARKKSGGPKNLCPSALVLDHVPHTKELHRHQWLPPD